MTNLSGYRGATSWVEVEVSRDSFNDLFMSKVEQVESELRTLSESRFDITMAKSARVGEPQGS
jgi:hypothetical protein